ncbi:MAG TPA: acyl-CoA dehydrogenase family protein [Chthoniobacterales bacterium]|jgi:glutaryl-CoA dehydrogenase|nr:acyl-CoA dehydrogenase family protein [Chthoniobacterales bacterium]HEV3393216.1 acyl-CoA dehydrogenase family protein [Chthoniobacterales bacterium]
MSSLDYYRIEELLTDEERAPRDRARRFVQEEAMPEIVPCHRAGKFPDNLIPRMGELGFFAPYLREYGCAGVSYTAFGLMMQELERGDSGLRSLASVQGALAIHAIHSFGTPEQHERWLPGLVSGKTIGCFALTEHGHGSDPGGMETRATRDGGHYVLNGSKCWIGNASIADVKVVWAKGDDGKVGGFIVEKDAPGFRAQDIEGKFSLRMSRTSECWFENCRIPIANRLPKASGLRAPLSCLSQARVSITWGVIGAAIDCYEAALAYAKSRKQFDRPIAGFQLVQEKLVWMVNEITKAQLLALRLTRMMEAGTARPEQISLAKRNNAWMALECARKARDILGAVGITDRFSPIRHLMNLETVNTYEGTSDIHLLVIGRDVTGIGAFGP